MTEPQRSPDVERRHPYISHEQLRRHLIDADQDRYRLQNELASATARQAPGGTRWTGLHRRVAVGAGIMLVTGLAGGLVWQMCPSLARADDRSVQVQTTTVTPRIVSGEGSGAKPVALKTVAKSPVKRRAARLTSTSERGRAKSVPRPLSPGEFGRPRAAY
jgi:hypothetical protein